MRQFYGPREAEMARKVQDKQLDTRETRGKLAPRGKPYWRTIERGLHLGYRRLKGRAGTWWARHYLGHQEYETESLGLADDLSDADGLEVLDYWQAQTKARTRWAARVKAAAGVPEPLTVNAALDRYETDLDARNGDTANVARVRLHLPEGLASKPVRDLNADDFKPWRAGLRKAKLTDATINRIGAALRAALNGAADAEKILDRSAWKLGLKAIPNATAARNVILTESQVLAVVAEAYRESDRFGELIETAAMTGARYSQLAAVEIQDLQSDRDKPRIMVPASKKGGGVKMMTRQPVPITTGLATRLRRAAADRPTTAPLFVKPSGEPWKKSDQQVPFFRAASRAGLDPQEVTMYALRHSSIVRELLAGVPIRVVAVTHDTSVGQIERTYSAHIAGHADELTRGALLDTSGATPATAANVVPLARV
jgi:integrase